MLVFLLPSTNLAASLIAVFEGHLDVALRGGLEAGEKAGVQLSYYYYRVV